MIYIALQYIRAFSVLDQILNFATISGEFWVQRTVSHALITLHCVAGSESPEGEKSQSRIDARTVNQAFSVISCARLTAASKRSSMEAIFFFGSR